MNGLEAFLIKFWGVIVACIGFVVWLVRLEGKANTNVKDIQRLEKRQDEDRHAITETLREIQQDIKKLLGQH